MNTMKGKCLVCGSVQPNCYKSPVTELKGSYKECFDEQSEKVKKHILSAIKHRVCHYNTICHGWVEKIE